MSGTYRRDVQAVQKLFRAFFTAFRIFLENISRRACPFSTLSTSTSCKTPALTSPGRPVDVTRVEGYTSLSFKLGQVVDALTAPSAFKAAAMPKPTSDSPVINPQTSHLCTNFQNKLAEVQVAAHPRMGFFWLQVSLSLLRTSQQLRQAQFWKITNQVVGFDHNHSPDRSTLAPTPSISLKALVN